VQEYRALFILLITEKDTVLFVCFSPRGEAYKKGMLKKLRDKARQK
jgi:hypothetical protein